MKVYNKCISRRQKKIREEIIMGHTLEFKSISKYFPGVKALDEVSFTAKSGEVLALLGENGAGKSTLLKILNGDYQPTSGKYIIDGVEKHFKTPQEAINDGISVIYQERQILNELSIAENIFLGRMPSGKFGVIDNVKANRLAQDIIDDFGLPLKSTDVVKDISVAHQQMVEIMKAYSRDHLKIICFDEPTASLSESEIKSLFKIINKLRNEGKIIIYITHRMDEIKAITDQIVILKDGTFIAQVSTNEKSDDELITMMVGRDLGDIFNELPKREPTGDVLLEVTNLESDFVKPNTFELKRGEILGFSGLVGSGRTELIRAIIGADKVKSGVIKIDGEEVKNKSPYHAMKNGIALVPEDRKTQGILVNLDVKDNINISMLDEHSNMFGILNSKKEVDLAIDGIEKFNIRTPDHNKKIVELSGGNQQKCIVARWVSTMPKVLILDEPTKGIDVGAKAEFYRMITLLANEGIGVILISSELPEVLGLSDRIIVMKDLKIVTDVMTKDTNETDLLRLGMIGDAKNEKTFEYTV